MGIDRYTKVVLTVIAFCLLFLCIRLYRDPQSVRAQGTPAPAQEVKIVGIADSIEIPVRLIGVAEGTLVPVRLDGSGKNVIVPVGIAGGRGTIPVSIQGANPAVTVPIGIRGVRYNTSNNSWEWAPIPVKQAP
jgi:hypothetical protein